MDKSKLIVILLLMANHCFSQNSNIADNAKAIFSMPIEQTFFRRYAHPIEDSLILSSKIKDERINDNDKFELFLASNYPNERASHIQLFHKMTVSNLGDDFIVIKYREIKDTVALKTISKVFKINKETFVEIPNDAVGQMYEAISILKTESFRAFLNPESTKIPEIDNIKAQFKDSEGILDIDKLGAYLKTKPAALAKYCDFE